MMIFTFFCKKTANDVCGLLNNCYTPNITTSSKLHNVSYRLQI